MALLIVSVLLVGIVLGGALPELGGAAPSMTPAPRVTPSPPATGLPTSDVPGEDLARLPRYPGSVRSEHEISADDRHRLTATEFMADATIDDVRAFYQGVIVEHGWERADIDYSGGSWTYVLVDGATEALIEIEITNGLVEIDLQVSEPIERPTPTAAPTPTPVVAPPPPQPAPPAPGGDDDDDGDDDDGGDGSDGWSDD
jgi:hypothetical protein